jgi:hypothetical protein
MESDLSDAITDVIIVEDDPYYFLQQGPYTPKSGRSVAAVKHDQDKFLAGLAPSYLKFDYQGRVVRLDTFSKVIACSPSLHITYEFLMYFSMSLPAAVSAGSLAALKLPNVSSVRVRLRHRRHAASDR